MNTDEWIVIIVTIILVIAIVVYFVVLLWAKQTNRFMFAPYTPPPLTNGYAINGMPTTLTQQEQENRRKLIEAAIGQNTGLQQQTIDLVNLNL